MLRSPVEFCTRLSVGIGESSGKSELLSQLSSSLEPYKMLAKAILIWMGLNFWNNFSGLKSLNSGSASWVQ